MEGRYAPPAVDQDRSFPPSEGIAIAATKEGSSHITAECVATNSLSAAKAIEIGQLPEHW